MRALATARDLEVIKVEIIFGFGKKEFGETLNLFIILLFFIAILGIYRIVLALILEVPYSTSVLNLSFLLQLSLR